eukprot:TRINITY_DN2155_c0_g1_i5.p3 TRINITY_DN2155_c0_g1~~TRINITY_DN2155_c0_g1_i5.p3  ORF type:complete len:148 (-),score=5.21 TRINITY_DN2155_c0_g1_i5:317-760(-)
MADRGVRATEKAAREEAHGRQRGHTWVPAPKDLIFEPRSSGDGDLLAEGAEKLEKLGPVTAARSYIHHRKWVEMCLLHFPLAVQPSLSLHHQLRKSRTACKILGMRTRIYNYSQPVAPRLAAAGVGDDIGGGATRVAACCFFNVHIY